MNWRKIISALLQMTSEKLAKEATKQAEKADKKRK